MAASIDPFSLSQQEEIRNLQAENASLREELTAIREEMKEMREEMYAEFSHCKKRISKIERVRPAHSSQEHLDKLETEIRKRNVPGVTFKAAASILGLDRSSISKMTPKIKEDSRFRIRLHGKKKVIELF